MQGCSLYDNGIFILRNSWNDSVGSVITGGWSSNGKLQRYDGQWRDQSRGTYRDFDFSATPVVSGSKFRTSFELGDTAVHVVCCHLCTRWSCY